MKIRCTLAVSAICLAAVATGGQEASYTEALVDCAETDFDDGADASGTNFQASAEVFDFYVYSGTARTGTDGQPVKGRGRVLGIRRVF